jgi:hypothetical protein
MRNTNYKLGIFIDINSVRYQHFGFGVIWDNEKYVHFNIFNFEVAIGKVDR